MASDASYVTSRVRIRNMCCKKEADLLRTLLTNNPGVTSVKVSVVGRLAFVTHSIPAEELLTILNEAQLGASLQSSGNESVNLEKLSCFDLWFPLLLVVCWLTGLALQLAKLPRAAEYVSLVTAGVGLVPVLYKAKHALKHWVLDINFLMGVAVVGALILQQWFDAGLVVVLLALAGQLEEYCLMRVRNSLKSAGTTAVPLTAVLAETNKTIPVADIKAGDVLAVRSGEQLPVDGIVDKGTIYVDESLVTGEATPEKKLKDSKVLGGTMCTLGYAEVRASSSFNASSIATIANMVEEAQATSSETQLLLDQIVTLYTPIILLIAAAVAFGEPLFWHGSLSTWILRALVVLISACPCALTIAASVPSLSSIASGAKAGVLVKTCETLEKLSKVTSFAFDKTGTLTEGNFRVSNITMFGDMPEELVMHLVGSLESKSSHPLAAALVNHVVLCVTDAVMENGLNAGLSKVANFEAKEGEGISGDVNYKLPDKSGSQSYHVVVGNDNILDAESKTNTEEFRRHQEGTLLYVKVDGAFQLAISLCDQIRPGAANLITELHNLDIRTMMLTGDNVNSMCSVQRQTGVSEGKASCKPEDKLNWVSAEMRRGRTVALMGDGINDSPALATCDIGMAMGAGGSALAVKSADVVFMNNDLEMAPRLIHLSRFTKKVIIQNVVLAIVIKFGVVVLALLGYAKLWMAVVADVGSLLLVLLNSMRPFAFDFTPETTTKVSMLSSAKVCGWPWKLMCTMFGGDSEDTDATETLVNGTVRQYGSV